MNKDGYLKNKNKQKETDKSYFNHYSFYCLEYTYW